MVNNKENIKFYATGGDDGAGDGGLGGLAAPGVGDGGLVPGAGDDPTADAKDGAEGEEENKAEGEEENKAEEEKKKAEEKENKDEEKAGKKEEEKKAEEKKGGPKTPGIEDLPPDAAAGAADEFIKSGLPGTSASGVESSKDDIERLTNEINKIPDKVVDDLLRYILNRICIILKKKGEYGADKNAVDGQLLTDTANYLYMNFIPRVFDNQDQKDKFMKYALGEDDAIGEQNCPRDSVNKNGDPPTGDGSTGTGNTLTGDGSTGTVNTPAGNTPAGNTPAGNDPNKDNTKSDNNKFLTPIAIAIHNLDNRNGNGKIMTGGNIMQDPCTDEDGNIEFMLDSSQVNSENIINVLKCKLRKRINEVERDKGPLNIIKTHFNGIIDKLIEKSKDDLYCTGHNFFKIKDQNQNSELPILPSTSNDFGVIMKDAFEKRSKGAGAGAGNGAGDGTAHDNGDDGSENSDDESSDDEEVEEDGDNNNNDNDDNAEKDGGTSSTVQTAVGIALSDNNNSNSGGSKKNRSNRRTKKIKSKSKNRRSR